MVPYFLRHWVFYATGLAYVYPDRPKVYDLAHCLETLASSDFWQYSDMVFNQGAAAVTQWPTPTSLDPLARLDGYTGTLTSRQARRE
jgi:hypothetical protein